MWEEKRKKFPPSNAHILTPMKGIGKNEKVSRNH